MNKQWRDELRRTDAWTEHDREAALDGLDIAETVIDHYRGHHVVCERARKLLKQWDIWKEQP